MTESYDIDSFEAQIMHDQQGSNVNNQENDIDVFSFEKILSFYDNCNLSLKKEIRKEDDKDKTVLLDILDDDVRNNFTLIRENTDASDDETSSEYNGSKNNYLTNEKTKENFNCFLDAKDIKEIGSLTENNYECKNKHNVLHEVHGNKFEISTETSDDIANAKIECEDIATINELLEKIKIEHYSPSDKLQKYERYRSRETNERDKGLDKVPSNQETNQEFVDDNIDCSLCENSKKSDKSCETYLKKFHNNKHCFSEGKKHQICVENSEESDEDNCDESLESFCKSFNSCEEFIENNDVTEERVCSELSEESNDEDDNKNDENFVENKSLNNYLICNKDSKKWRFYSKGDNSYHHIFKFEKTDKLNTVNDERNENEVFKEFSKFSEKNGRNEVETESDQDGDEEDNDENEQNILRSRGREKSSQKRHNEKPYDKQTTLFNSYDTSYNESQTELCPLTLPPSFDILHDESLNAYFSDSGYASSPASSIHFTDTNEDKVKFSNEKVQSSVESFTNLTLLELFSEEHVLRSLESIVSVDTESQSSMNTTNLSNSNNCNKINDFDRNDSNHSTCENSNDSVQEHVNEFCPQEVFSHNNANTNADGENNPNFSAKILNNASKKKTSKSSTTKTVPVKKADSPRKAPVPLVCKFEDGIAKSQLYSILHKDRLRLVLSKYYKRNQVLGKDEVIYVTDLKGEKGKHLNMTNLHVAVLNSDFEEIYAVVELQKQYKKNFSDINRKDAEKKTALDYAMEKNLPLIVDYLKDNTAKQSIVMKK